MRAQLLHLSGPYRGKTTTYGRRRMRIGTAPDATLRFPLRSHVAKNHAEITFAEAEGSFHIPAGGTCKPVRQMLRDAHPFPRESVLIPLPQSPQRDPLFQSSWQARLVM